MKVVYRLGQTGRFSKDRMVTCAKAIELLRNRKAAGDILPEVFLIDEKKVHARAKAYSNECTTGGDDFRIGGKDANERISTKSS